MSNSGQTFKARADLPCGKVDGWQKTCCCLTGDETSGFIPRFFVFCS